MKKSLLALAAAALAFSGAAFADPTNSCANPLPNPAQTPPNSTAGPFDLCQFPNSLPGYGALASPHRDAIFRFTASANAAANGATISLSNNTFGGIVVLLPTPCALGTEILNAGDQDVPMVIPPGQLVAGQQFFVIVTADANLPGDPCGTFTLSTTGELPVELEEFSVE